MISSQVEKLRKLASEVKTSLDFVDQKKLYKALSNAADIIEEQSEKLATANREHSTLYCNKWIPCDECLPEEKVDPITRDFYEYEVTFESENVRDIRHYKFGHGHWWHGPGMVDEYVTAWRPRPEPYKRKRC